MATTQQADKDRKDTGATDAKNSDSGNGNSSGGGAGQSDNLRDSPMMAHLMDALEEVTDIGHYGRLTFAMSARHFMKED